MTRVPLTEFIVRKMTKKRRHRQMEQACEKNESKSKEQMKRTYEREEITFINVYSLDFYHVKCNGLRINRRTTSSHRLNYDVLASVLCMCNTHCMLWVEYSTSTALCAEWNFFIWQVNYSCESNFISEFQIFHLLWFRFLNWSTQANHIFATATNTYTHKQAHTSNVRKCEEIFSRPKMWAIDTEGLLRRYIV